MYEFCPHNTAVAVWSCHLAPYDSDLGTLSFTGGSIDKRYSLSEIEPTAVLVSLSFLPPVLLDIPFRVWFLTVRLLSHRHLRS